MEQLHTQSTASVKGVKINTILVSFNQNFESALMNAYTGDKDKKEVAFGIYANANKQLTMGNRTTGQADGVETNIILDVNERPAGYPDLIAVYHCHPRDWQYSCIPSGCMGNKDKDWAVANDEGHKGYFYLVGTLVYKEKPKDKNKDKEKEKAILTKHCHSLTTYNSEPAWQMWVVFNAAAKQVDFP